MTRKAITTSHAVVSCDVCGRTLLRGEHADVFLHGGQRRMVCELCTPRAAHEGWIREGLDDARVRDSGDRRSRSLLGRLRNRLAEVPEHEGEGPPAITRLALLLIVLGARALTALGLATVDDDLHVRVVLVVLREPVVQLRGQLLWDHAVDHSSARL